MFAESCCVIIKQRTSAPFTTTCYPYCRTPLQDTIQVCDAHRNVRLHSGWWRISYSAFCPKLVCRKGGSSPPSELSAQYRWNMILVLLYTIFQYTYSSRPRHCLSGCCLFFFLQGHGVGRAGSHGAPQVKTPQNIQSAPPYHCMHHTM